VTSSDLCLMERTR